MLQKAALLGIFLGIFDTDSFLILKVKWPLVIRDKEEKRLIDCITLFCMLAS
jgi:hypothetical protein